MRSASSQASVSASSAEVILAASSHNAGRFETGADGPYSLMLRSPMSIPMREITLFGIQALGVKQAADSGEACPQPAVDSLDHLVDRSASTGVSGEDEVQKTPFLHERVASSTSARWTAREAATRCALSALPRSDDASRAFKSSPARRSNLMTCSVVAGTRAEAADGVSVSKGRLIVRRPCPDGSERASRTLIGVGGQYGPSRPRQALNLGPGRRSLLGIWGDERSR